MRAWPFSIAGHVASFGHPRWRETHSASTCTAPVLDRLLSAGASIAGLAKLDQLAKDLATLRLVLDVMADVHAGVPAAGVPVSTLRLTTPASLTGRPELVIPVRTIGSGGWIGVGILGPVGGDSGLLRLAAGICPLEGPVAL